MQVKLIQMNRISLNIAGIVGQSSSIYSEITEKGFYKKMRIIVEKIDLLDITRDNALEILAEINKATNGTVFHQDKYPMLHELYQLLNGTFQSSVHGVHHISKRD